MPDPKLDEGAFRARYLERFADPAFEPLRAELDRVAGVAWAAYDEGRKAPVTRKAGPDFADPSYDLSADWLAGKAAIDAAKLRHADPAGPLRVLLVNASPRSEHTCPSEMSKSWRLLQLARAEFAADDVKIEVLELNRLASEFGRHIHPCKACFSTAAPLCHFPCSCYPNHAEGQVQDWMNDIYPMWVEAHGIMLITPVHWYQVTSPLKLMMDRMVCVDGGNPDPTLTQGKDAKLAKTIELEGWDYPRHLEGRLFSAVVHGDVEGTLEVRRAIHDWLCFMHLSPAGSASQLHRYIGYWKPYATSHEALDKDQALQAEVRNAARALLDGMRLKRAGRLEEPGAALESPRQK